MKRILLTIISVCLVLASLFGIYSSFKGLDDVTYIKREKNEKRTELSDKLDALEDAIAELDALEEKNKEDELDYATGVASEGKESELESGEAQYASGLSQYNSSKAQYDASLKQYQDGEAKYAAAEAQLAAAEQEYAAAEQRLKDGEAQLAEAKQQYAEGEAKLSKASPAYAAAKTYIDLRNDSGLSVADKFGYTSLGDQIAINYGYSSLNELIAEYEDGQAQLNEANREITAAEQEIEAGKTQLANAKLQIENGKTQLANSRTQLDSGKSQLASAEKQLKAGKATLDSAASQIASGKQTLAENLEKMQDALPELKEYKDTQAYVEASVAVLLETEAISEKVPDDTDYAAVLSAAREYMDEDAANVDDELTLRQSLYSLLRIISFVGVVAGTIGVIASTVPTAAKLRLTMIFDIITAVTAVGLNVFGLINNYFYFVCKLNDGSCTGSLQLTAMLLLGVLALLAALLSSVCYKAFRSGVSLAQRNARPRPERAPREDSFVPDDYVPYEEEAPQQEYYEEPVRQTYSRPAAPSTASRSTAAAYTPKAAAPRTPPKSSYTPRPAVAVNDPIVSASSENELEIARREYEEAKRRFEQARNKK